MIEQIARSNRYIHSIEHSNHIDTITIMIKVHYVSDGQYTVAKMVENNTCRTPRVYDTEI